MEEELLIVKVLIISYAFAPDSIVGARRFSALSRYFPQYGVEPVIATIKRTQVHGVDNSLRHGGRILRIFNPLPWPPRMENHPLFRRIYAMIMRHMAPIDKYIGWTPGATIKLVNKCRVEKPDLLVATGPPFSSFIVAYIVSKVTSTPFLLDYRDPWTAYKWTYKHFTYEKLVERVIAANAIGAVFCTEQLRTSYCELHRYFKADSAHTIYSGYDGVSVRPAVLHKDAIDISYAGSFYGQRNLRMLIEPILKVRECLGKKIYVNVWGNVLEADRRAFRAAGISEILIEHSKIPRAQLLPKLAASDVLFCPSGSDVNYAIPYKFLEYLPVGTPLLIVSSPNSEIASLSKRYGIGYFGRLGDQNSIERALFRAISERNRQMPPEDMAWPRIAKKYSLTLKHLLWRQRHRAMGR